MAYRGRPGQARRGSGTGGWAGIAAVLGPVVVWTGVTASRSSTRTWMTLRCCRAARSARGGGPPGSSPPERAVEAVLQVQLPVPLDGVREQVPVEGRVVGQQRVQSQLALRRHQGVQAHLPRRDHRPVPRGQAVVGIRAAVTYRFEDQGTDLRLLPATGAPTEPHPIRPIRPAPLPTGADPAGHGP